MRVELPILPFQHYALQAFDALRAEDPAGEFHFFGGTGRLLDAPHDAGLAAFERAHRALVDHHEAFRVSFVRRDDRWHQELHAPGTLQVDTPVAELDDSFEHCQEEILEVLKSFYFDRWDIGAAPLMRLGVIRTRDRTLVAQLTHHILADWSSSFVVASDLERALGAAIRGSAIELPPPATSYSDYANYVGESLRKPLRSEEAELAATWLTGAASRSWPTGQVELLEVMRSITTRRLHECARRLDVPVADVLITAVLDATATCVGGERLALLVHHGRSERMAGLDLSRTVAPVLVYLPLLAERVTGRTPLEAIRATHQRRRSVPVNVSWKLRTELFDAIRAGGSALEINYRVHRKRKGASETAGLLKAVDQFSIPGFDKIHARMAGAPYLTRHFNKNTAVWAFDEYPDSPDEEIRLTVKCPQARSARMLEAFDASLAGLLGDS